MVTTIEAHAEQVSMTLGRNYIAPQVLKAVSAVPRHEFVSDLLRGDAYADRPLLIGYGQTISQPFVVALMTDLVRGRPISAVLAKADGVNVSPPTSPPRSPLLASRPHFSFPAGKSERSRPGAVYNQCA
jgi:hypothetical protein